MGFTGLRCGGARAFPDMAYCCVGFEANCNVKLPSDHRSMRAFDWISSGLAGECLHLIVLMAVLKAENEAGGSFREWCSLVGGSNAFVWNILGSMLRKLGTLRRYICERQTMCCD